VWPIKVGFLALLIQVTDLIWLGVIIIASLKPILELIPTGAAVKIFV
jgi:hypothetical protein